MGTVRTYKLNPTQLMPNLPHVLLHYSNALSAEECNAAKAHDLFSSHGWDVKWVARYGPTQPSHYHSTTHEAMAVLSGTATLRFGAGDILVDGQVEGKEDGGIEIQAQPGDVFVLPAGLAHKTFNPSPETSRKFFKADEEAYQRSSGAKREALRHVDISGFTMIGAYPNGCQWNWADGGDDIGNFDKIWSIPTPSEDPVLGTSEQGLCGLWKAEGNFLPLLPAQ